MRGPPYQCSEAQGTICMTIRHAEACELMMDGWEERSGIGGWLLLLGEEKMISKKKR